MPTTLEELAELVKIGKITRPTSWEAITKSGTVMLKPKEKLEVPLVFFTQRDASLSTLAEASSSVIKERVV